MDSIRVLKVFGKIVKMPKFKIKVDWYFIILLLSCSLTWYVYEPVAKYKFVDTTHRCKLLQKHHSPPAYQVREKFEFYLRDEASGRTFDIDHIHFATYNSCKVGDYVNFSLTEWEIESKGSLELLSMFYFLMWVIDIILLIVVIVNFFNRNEDDR